MIKIDGLKEVVAQIKSERGIPEEEILSAISDALVLAAKRYHGPADNLRAVLNDQTGEATIIATKLVVKEVVEPSAEISLKDAKKLNPKAKVDEEVEIEVIPPDFGRIAAQKAKQVITQRIVEAEKKSIMSEFEDKIGHLVTGIVQRIEGRNYLINLGRTEAVLDLRNQIPEETFRLKDRVKLYLVDIAKTHRGPEVIVSRSHEGFVKKMFELEVPEIADGVIEVKAIARRAGYRTKLAVQSHDPEVGAVGTCVGRMGARIQMVLKELNGEKIDIIEWKEDISELIANALKPAVIYKIEIDDLEKKRARAIVEDDQLSLAIGKTGLNVRLASKLTGWNIDVVRKGDVEVNLIDKLLAEKKSLQKQKEAEDKVDEKASAKEELKKIKVNEAASELGMDVADFMAKLELAGHKVKSEKSNIDYDVYMKIKEEIV